jgi:hypothetical protein
MIRSRSFAAGDFFLHPSGVVRLNPKLARYVASEVQVERQTLLEVAGAVIEIVKEVAAPLPL